MTPLRIGTRGSELARTQTRWVGDLLRSAHPDLQIEEVIIATHGDRHPDQPMSAEDWPMGGFVGAIERALLENRIDLAVHSYKDLPTHQTPGLHIAAVPKREAPHDVLVTASPIALDDLPEGFRLGTSSPRRAAQFRRQFRRRFRRLAHAKIIPLRGNVPSRLRSLGDTLDGVVLAAAGMRRLGVSPEFAIDLPVERFVPAPGQGALAVQVRAADDEPEPWAALAAAINDPHAAPAVAAERALLSAIGAGCSTPLGALGWIADDGRVELRAQLFSDETGRHVAEGFWRLNVDDDPVEAGRALAGQLQREMAQGSTA